jgi:TRAP-type C4-dicarboxylate transport system permease large subunit
MILFIIIGAVSFSELLAFSGASRALVKFSMENVNTPIGALVIMMLIVMLLGCFIDQSGIIMLVIPIFMPIVNAMEINQIWFAILMLINLEMAALTPPVGLILYVVKGIMPEIELKVIMKSALPFVACDTTAMVLIMIFPQIATWLPMVAIGK